MQIFVAYQLTNATGKHGLHSSLAYVVTLWNMALTIMNPAVMEPSHMPRMSRTAKRPPKFLHAACEQSATPHVKMLML